MPITNGVRCGLRSVEERLGRLVERAGEAYAHADELRHRQVDLPDLLEVELVTQPSYALDLGRLERLRSVAGELGPRGAFELDIR